MFLSIKIQLLTRAHNGATPGVDTLQSYSGQDVFETNKGSVILLSGAFAFKLMHLEPVIFAL